MSWEPYDSRGRPNTPKSNPHDISLAAEPLRSRAAQMVHDCPWPGELGYSSIYRDPGTQWDFRDQRVGRANIWNFPPRGNPTTAVPARWNYTSKQWEGGSHHQTGHAVDFGGTERAMQWMMEHRESYGLAHTVTTERWHQEADAHDTITGRIHNHPTVPIQPFGTHPTPQPPEDDMYSEEDRKRDDTVAKQVGYLHDDYAVTGKGVRQVIAQIDTRTTEIVKGIRKLLLRKA